MTYEGPWEGDIAQIDFTRSAQEVHNFIRGSDRAPGAWSTINGDRITLYGSTLAAGGGSVGAVVGVSDDGVTIACGDGAVQVDLVRDASGQRLAASEWASAAGIAPGATFERSEPD